MKPLVIVLAVGIFVGNEMLVLSNEPGAQLDSLEKTSKAFFKTLVKDLQEKDDIVRGSAVGGELLGLLYSVNVQASRNLRRLEAELPTEVTEGFDAVVGITTGVVEKGLKVLYEAWRKEDLEGRLKSALGDLYSNGPLGKVGSYAETVLSDLINRSRESNQKLNEELKEELDKLSSYAQGVQSQVYQFQELVQPVANQMVEGFKMAAEAINKVAKPYFAPFLKAARGHITDFKQWVSAPVFPPEQ
ncbi:hypothetical protein lerEdw1_009769 [Lerista edwardsae]|nr:hypothetical protein lerEdw1_009769 [Lerista edwardsae]